MQHWGYQQSGPSGFRPNCSNDRQRVFRCIAVEVCRRHPHVILTAPPRSLPVFPLGDVDRDPPAPLRVLYYLLLLVLFRVLQHRGLSHCTAEKGVPPPLEAGVRTFPMVQSRPNQFSQVRETQAALYSVCSAASDCRHRSKSRGVFEWS